MAALIHVSPMPIAAWGAMVLLTLVAVWVCREDLRGFAVARPLAARYVMGLLVAVVGAAVAVNAVDVRIYCDWNQILEACGGSEACAWAVWIWNGCPFIG